MNSLGRKSIDPNVNALLKEVSGRQLALSWDLHEANLPRCGFGDLGLCCSECWQGPCRVDPFGHGAGSGSCGRTGEAMVTEKLARQVLAGLAPVIAELADPRLTSAQLELQNWLNAGMNQRPEKILSALFDLTGQAMQQASTTKVQNVQADLDIDPDQLTVVVTGRIPAETLNLLKTTANVQVFSLLNEFPLPGVQPLTNYGSQEMILAAKIPDLLVIAPGCGMPNLLAVADAYGIPCVYSDELTADLLGNIKISGYTALAFNGSTSKPLTDLTVLKNRKVALLAGCNTLRTTQDGEILKLAKELTAKGYAIVTSGCAGMALRKYADQVGEIYELGSCYETARFVQVYRELQSSSGQIAAFFPELSQPKALAQALGLAANGIRTYILSAAPVGGKPVVRELLQGIQPELRIAGEGLATEAVLAEIL